MFILITKLFFLTQERVMQKASIVIDFMFPAKITYFIYVVL